MSWDHRAENPLMDAIGSSEFYLGPVDIDHIPPQAGGIEPEETVFDDEICSRP